MYLIFSFIKEKLELEIRFKKNNYFSYQVKEKTKLGTREIFKLLAKRKFNILFSFNFFTLILLYLASLNFY